MEIATKVPLEAALQFDGFDAYVFDWVLPNGAAAAVVAMLTKPACDMFQCVARRQRR